MASKIENLLGTVRIRELPKRQVCRVDVATSLGEVYRLLDEEHAVAVLVYEGEALAGIFTERDILYRTALEEVADTPIGELMTRDLVTGDPEDLVASAIGVMTERHIRHLPLRTGQGRDEGMVGGRDVLRLIADYFPETLLNLPPRLHQRLSRLDGG